MRLRIAIIAIPLIAAAYLLFWPVGISPGAWRPASPPPMSGDFEPNTRLVPVERIMAGVPGPEDVAVDAEGRTYVGTAERHIVRAADGGGRLELFADTLGRPLGLDFDHAGHLLVADARRGLVSVSPDGEVTTLATTDGEIPFRFVNDVDLGPDGIVYFSDSSWTHGPENVQKIIIEHRPEGRLLAYDPNARSVRRVLSGLHFANGVAVSPDGRFVLVCETAAYRVMRHWLAGPRAGQTEVFIDNLPGFPDGISAGSGGVFWLAVFAPRNAILDGLMPRPFLRKILLRIPSVVLPPPARYAFVLGLDADGRVVHNLQDPDGGYAPIASVGEFGGHLYLGSLEARAVARLPVPR